MSSLNTMARWLALGVLSTLAACAPIRHLTVSYPADQIKPITIDADYATVWKATRNAVTEAGYEFDAAGQGQDGGVIQAKPMVRRNDSPQAYVFWPYWRSFGLFDTSAAWRYDFDAGPHRYWDGEVDQGRHVSAYAVNFNASENPPDAWKGDQVLKLSYVIRLDRQGAATQVTITPKAYARYILDGDQARHFGFGDLKDLHDREAAFPDPVKISDMHRWAWMEVGVHPRHPNNLLDDIRKMAMAMPRDAAPAANAAERQPDAKGPEAQDGAAKVNPTRGDVRQRLERLDQLRKDGVISADEYARSRAAILADL